tara:strand:- start:822 stop:1034 length:213 start_codon:yes stop_codon:yes gene_type:complete
MGLTKFQKEANEEHFIKHLSMIKDGGFYFWIDQQEKMMIKNNKYDLTQIQYAKMLHITSKKFMKKYTSFI